MEILIVFAVLAVIGLIVRGLMGGDPVTYPGRQLQQKFISLGNMAGKKRKDIEAVVGPPNSISSIVGGKSSMPVDGDWISHCARVQR